MTFVLGVLLLVPATACQDHDPLSPVAPRHMRPKVSKTLSDGVALVSPVDMNTSGEVLGYLHAGEGYQVGISVSGVAYALGTTDSSAPITSYPTAINNRGAVVANEQAGLVAYGVLWTPDEPNGTTGQMRRLPDSPNGPAVAQDINDAGQIVGIAGTSGIVLWNGSDVVSLPLPIAGGSVQPTTINQFGQIAGTAVDVNGVAHAVLWTPTAPNGTTGSYLLLDAPGSAGGIAVGLNDFGQLVVATREGDPRLWTPTSPNAQTGSWTTLTGPAGPLSAVDINSRGDVLASAHVGDNDYCWVYHLYLWRPSTPNDITGTTIDLTPDVGTDLYNCSAKGSFVSEEENATIQAFGYGLEESAVSYYEYYHDQMWTVANLDQPQPLTDQPLTASITAIYGGLEGYPVTFEGRASPYSPDLTYVWDFGDGTSEADRSATHTYADNGEYRIRFTVTDSTAHSNTATTTIIVSNIAPTGTFIAPTQTNEGGSYVLSVSNVSDVSTDFPTVQLALDCGDGGGYQSVAITGSLTCAAPNDVIRTARAQLRDKDGGVTEYARQVTIVDVAPTVTVLSAPAGIADKTTYTISFKFSDPGLLDSWAYRIDWGDGTSSALVSVTTQGGTLSASHKYQIDRRGGNKSQTFVVTIRVNDNGGAVGTATSAVVVTGNGAL